MAVYVEPNSGLAISPLNELQAHALLALFKGGFISGLWHTVAMIAKARHGSTLGESREEYF